MNPERDTYYFHPGQPSPPLDLIEFHRHEPPNMWAGMGIGGGRFWPSMEYPLGGWPSWYRVPPDQSYAGGPWPCDVCWSDWRWVD